MIFHIKENLPNIVQDGILKKIYAEMVTETKQNKKETTIKGDLLITRELKVPNSSSNSEITIKDRFPIDITVYNDQKNNKEAEVCLNFQSFNVGFDKDCTEFSGKIELTNVKDKAEQLA